MLSNAGSETAVIVLSAVSASNTAGATSGWIDCTKYKGTLVFCQQVGAVTGSIAGKLQSASDSGGTGAADITGATWTSVSAADKVQSITVPATTAPFIKYIGTVTTGPAIVSVVMMGYPAS